MTDQGIQTLLDDYFELMHTQDMSLFDKVFHKDSNLYSSENDELVIRSADLYRSQMEARTSPQDSGNARRDEVLFIMVHYFQAVQAGRKVRLVSRDEHFPF